MAKTIDGSEIDKIEMPDGSNPTIIFLKNGEQISVYNIVINLQKIDNLSVRINQHSD